MSSLHSIWLMPAPENEAALQRIVENLAGQFASPLFQPHSTLVEEQDREPAELAAACLRSAAETERFSAAIQRIDTGDLYFRSLYALFSPEGALTTLRRSVLEALSLEMPCTFMPHISLLYGVERQAEKERARATLERELAGAEICFDRVYVVAAAKAIPIAEWAIRFMVEPHPTAQ